VANWRTIGVRLKEEQAAVLNQRLQQLGYATLGELVGGLAEGVINSVRLRQSVKFATATKADIADPV
jgi:hypothetical protein